VNDKIRTQSLTHLDCGKHAPTGNIAGAVANECMSIEHGDIDVVDEVVVAESRVLFGRQLTSSTTSSVQS